VFQFNSAVDDYDYYWYIYVNECFSLILQLVTMTITALLSVLSFPHQAGRENFGNFEGHGTSCGEQLNS